MTNYSEAQREALRAFAATLERGERRASPDREVRRSYESRFVDAPAARGDRPYYDSGYERYERMPQRPVDRYDRTPRDPYPVYDRSESVHHDYSVSL